MRTRTTSRTEIPEDDELQQLIMEKIDEDPAFWTGTTRRRVPILVDVDDGHVTLRGVVRNAMDRRRADILARALGATGVDNQLRVGDETPGNKGRERSVA